MRTFLFLLLFFAQFSLWGQSWKTVADSAAYYDNKGDYKKSKELYEQAFHLCERSNGATDSSTLLLINKVANMYRMDNQLERADSLLRISLLRQSKQEGLLYVQTLHEVGKVAKGLGNKESAINAFLKATEAAKKLGESDTMYVESLFLLANFYHEIGDLQKTLPIHLEIEKMVLAHHLPHKIKYLPVLTNISKLYDEMGLLAESIAYIQKTITIFEKIEGHQKMLQYVDACMQLADYYRVIGRKEDAKRGMKKSIALLLDIKEKDNHLLDAYMILADYAVYEQKADTAYLYLNEVIKWRDSLFTPNRPEYAIFSFGVGYIYYQLGDKSKEEECEKLFLSAHAIIQTMPNYITFYADIAQKLGKLYAIRKHDIEKAKPYYQKSIEIAKNTSGENTPPYFRNLYNYAVALQMNKQYAAALPLYEECLTNLWNFNNTKLIFLPEEEQATYRNNYRYLFIDFQDFIKEYVKEKPEIAGLYYDHILAEKNYLLKKVLQNKEVVLHSKQPEVLDLYNNWLQKKRNYAQLQLNEIATNPDLQALEVEIEQIERKLRETSTFTPYKADNYAKWQDIVRHLSKNEAAVEIVRIQKHKGIQMLDSAYYIALVLRSNSPYPEVIVLENGNYLEGKSFRNYSDNLAQNKKENESYRAFWLPIEAAVQGVEKVYLAADGIYHLLNLNLLQDEKGQFLLEKYEIHRLYATAELLEEKEAAKRKENQIVLMGNPKFDVDKKTLQTQAEIEKVGSYALRSQLPNTKRFGFNPLPYSEKEVNEIAAILKQKKWQKQVFVHDKASESVLYQLNAPTILHIATHGYAPSQIQKEGNPLLQSGLYFAGAKTTLESDSLSLDNLQNDGILSAYEAATLNLQGTELVVLSACETALGELRSGEGVYGLQRAFKIAGANTLIMSLWKVADAPTQQFMTSFYKELATGKTAYTALREVQIRLLKQGVATKDWGGFVLIGE